MVLGKDVDGLSVRIVVPDCSLGLVAEAHHGFFNFVLDVADFADLLNGLVGYHELFVAHA